MATRRQMIVTGIVGAAFAGPAARSQPRAGAGVCLLTPRQTEGPFYVEPAMVRPDIREDRRGEPLRLALQVVTADCRPIQGARVDVWHCDAQGAYSGFDRQGDDRRAPMAGRTFLRGTQMADAAGRANFMTIYPGWYLGRTAHIHFKVYLGAREAITSQLYFPEDINAAVYGRGGAYARTRPRDVFNANDGVFTGGKGTIAAISTTGGLTASLMIGVRA